MSYKPGEHYVDPTPYEPDPGTEARHAELDMANWRLVLRRFAQHRLGLVSGSEAARRRSTCAAVHKWI